MTYVAMGLLCFATFPGLHGTGVDLIDIKYFGNCGREGMWVHSIGCQAAARNTHYVYWSIMDQVGGPNTEMLLYEDAVSMLMSSVSGKSACFVTRSTDVKYPEYLSPLDCRFCAEVLKRSAGMSRKKANEIVKVLIPKYEHMLKDPPKGKSFRELYDLKTLQPVKEHLDLYLRVKKEMIELGIPLTPYY